MNATTNINNETFTAEIKINYAIAGRRQTTHNIVRQVEAGSFAEAAEIVERNCARNNFKLETAEIRRGTRGIEAKVWK